MNQATIIVVDDEPINLRLLKNVLAGEYKLVFAKSGQEAIDIAQSTDLDLILLDVMMPNMTGFETCEQIKLLKKHSHTPVIFITALNDSNDETKGFDVGGVDYITKPFSPQVVKARIKSHLSLVQVEALKQTQLEVVQRLGRAAEYKDNETGTHVIRMSHYSQILASAYGLSEAESETLLYAAPMHDIGKIGIPDNILQKPGKLTAEEYEVIKGHPQIGADIIGETTSNLLFVAKQVALYHHEKWNGTGYPHGLKGEDIPLVARIVAVADVFDALTSERPYKKAWPIEDVLALMRKESGAHFEPKLVELLEQNLDKFLEVKLKWSD